MKINRLILTMLLALSSYTALTAEYAVIVNKDNGENVDVRSRFLLQQGSDKWGSGGEVLPFEIDEGGSIKNLLIKKAFLKEILGMSGKSEYDKYWTDQKSAGRTVTPTKVKSFKKILRYVKRESGGIGYAPLKKARKAGVKIIKKFVVN